jgi:hypothetical protein
LFRIAIVAAAAGCGAGDNRIDPGDLELRDLLGVTPEAAASWDVDQRAAARRVLESGLDRSGDPALIPLASATAFTGAQGKHAIDERVTRSLLLHDSDRAGAGNGALGVVRIDLDRDDSTASVIAPRAVTAVAVANGRAAPAVELWMTERWDSDLPNRGLDLLAALATDAGHTTGPVVVAPGPRLPVIASYVKLANAPSRLLVNPVLLAALDPGEAAAPSVAIGVAGAPPAPEVPAAGRAVVKSNPTDPTTTQTGPAVANANPYSFYGSVAECAFAQRTRCESCVGTGTCEAITSSNDGDAECGLFATNSGRGYFLICANLALAIVSVSRCAADAVPGCPRDVTAASRIEALEANASFIDDATCSVGLDGCLAEIYGAPPEPFPGLDAGVSAPRPPRSTNVSCNDSCSNDNNSCEANPSCGEGPSCNNSLSCDSACSNSNDQSGCEGNCNACSEDQDSSGGGEGCGGDDGGGGGGCGSDDGGGGDGCGNDSSGGDGCGGNDNGGGGCGGDSGDGGGCGGDSGGGGGCGGDSGGGGGCGGDSGGGGGCGGDSGGGGGCGGSSSSSGGGCSGGGGGGSSSCNASRRESSPGATLAMSLIWGLMPIPAAAWVRRRARRRAQTPATAKEVGQ